MDCGWNVGDNDMLYIGGDIEPFSRLKFVSVRQIGAWLFSLFFLFPMTIRNPPKLTDF
jgi:hypothetical protein